MPTTLSAESTRPSDCEAASPGPACVLPLLPLSVGPVDPLCTARIGGLDCALEQGSFIASAPPPTTSLTVVAWNIAKSGCNAEGARGNGIAPQIAVLQDRSLIPEFDVLLLSEVSRGCAFQGRQCASAHNVSAARVFAEALGMAYAYGIERLNPDGGVSRECSEGNALLSRYPLLNVDQHTFEAQCCYGLRPPGRLAVTAQIELGGGISISASSTHLESGMGADPGFFTRAAQAAELARIGRFITPFAVVGGDLNAALRHMDPTLWGAYGGGLHDAHSRLPWWQRSTHDSGVMAFDYIFTRGLAVTEAVICHDDGCAGCA